MKILVTGCCGFVGSRLVAVLADHPQFAGRLELHGVDNLSRPGSERNRQDANARCTSFSHGDLRLASDVERLPRADWVVDTSANPSVLAGSGPLASSRQLIESNLLTTVNLLEYCKTHRAGLILVSSSRVYSIEALRRLPLHEPKGVLTIAAADSSLAECSAEGITENFPTTPPLSLYGATKLASETLALEYSATFDFPVWIDRCGLLAGAGQFGRADQGIIAYWIHSWFERRPLRYLGFGGRGSQVRDCLHPADLGELILRQMAHPGDAPHRIFNVAGGVDHQFSLAQLSRWCEQRWGSRAVASDPTERAADVPWLVLDSRRARSTFGWQPQTSRDAIFAEIAEHAERHPDWLSRAAGA